MDLIRGAIENELEPGDSILLKKVLRKSSKEEMDPLYHPEPFQRVQKNGNRCVVESPEGVQ